MKMRLAEFEGREREGGKGVRGEGEREENRRDWTSGNWEDLEGRMRKIEREREMKNGQEKKRNVII